MPFVKGQIANPLGRGVEAGAKRIRAAFVRMYDADPRKLDELALAAHTAATKGKDMGALTFIRDTLDGKPAQESIVTRTNVTVDMSDAELAARIADLSPPDRKPIVQ